MIVIQRSCLHVKEILLVVFTHDIRILQSCMLCVLFLWGFAVLEVYSHPDHDKGLDQRAAPITFRDSNHTS